MEWKAFPVFHRKRLAILVGILSTRPVCNPVKLPAGIKMMRRHPEDRIYTVLSGVFYIGRSYLQQQPSLTHREA